MRGVGSNPLPIQEVNKMARPTKTRTRLENVSIVPSTKHGDASGDTVWAIYAVDTDDIGTTPTAALSSTDTGILTLAGGATLDNTSSASILNITEATVRITGILDVTGATTQAGTSTVSVANATADTTVRAIVGSVTASGTAMTASHLSTGVRGIVTMSGHTVGNAYFYGVQGKLALGTVHINTGSQIWASALLGQLDFSGATEYTANVGAITALWADAGSSAHANSITAAPTYVDLVSITNSISTFKPHSMIRVQGDATNFMALSAWDTTVNSTGCDWIVAGGDTTAAAPHCLKLLVGSETLYIRLHSVA